MRNLLASSLLCVFIVGPAACHDDNPADTHAKAAPIATLDRVQQVSPPLDLMEPPADAIRLASGVAYKKLTSNDTGTQPRPEDTALVHYTAWRSNGETFFTSTGRSQPIAVKLSHSTSAFSEVLPLIRKGEKVRVWAPPSRALHDRVVYEIEMNDIVRPPVLANSDTSGRTRPDQPVVRATPSAQSGLAAQSRAAIQSTQSP